MKTGEEKFDDEVRQKLRYSEAKPPADFFNQVVPPKDSKRIFYWIWFTGILALLISAGWFQYTRNENMHRGKNIPVKNEQDVKTNFGINENNSANESVKEDQKIIDPGTSANIKKENVTGEENEGGITHERTETGAGVSESKPDSKYTASTSKNKSVDKQKDTDATLSHESEANIISRKNETSSSHANDYNYDFLFTPIPSLPFTSEIKVSQQIKILKPDLRAFDSHIPTPWSVEVVASKVFCDAKSTLENDDPDAARMFDLGNSADNEITGFNVGARVVYALNHKFSVSAGISYTQRKEQFRFNLEERYELYDVDTSLYYILFPFTPPQPVYELDTTTYTMSRIHFIEHDLTFQTYSAGADIRYAIPFRNFLIEPNIGIVADIFEHVKGHTNYNVDFMETTGDKHFEKSVQARLLGGIQIGYTLSEKFNLFLHSQYQYALNPMHTSQKFYSQKTNQVFVGTGIRYTFFKRQAAKTYPGGSEITKN